MDSAHRRFLLLALLSLSFSPGCREKGANKTNSIHSSLNSDRPELIMSTMHVQSYGEKGLDWEMQAPTAQGFTRKNYIQASQLHIDLYQNGQKSSVITADKGVLNTDQVNANNPAKADENGLDPGDMYLTGNVVLVSTDGSKLKTDWIHYHKSREIIESTAPVRVEREDSTTTGNGLEAKPDLSNVKIFDQTLIIKDRPRKKRR